MSETIGGIAPTAVYRPRSIDELRELVMARDGLTLIPAGAGTALDLGNRPDGPFALVHLGDAVRGPIEHQEDDLTVLAPATATIAAINGLLAPRNQRLAIDPPVAERATIGGALASGLSGPLRTRYGLPRDAVLGMTVLRADGVEVKAGGRVVKNVTGYDLMRLWCGSLGTLGIITQVALRVFPSGPTTDFTRPVADVAEGVALADAMYRQDVRLEFADIIEEAGRMRLVTRVPGGAAPLARTLLGQPGRESPGDADYALSRDAGHRPGDGLAVHVATTPSGVERVTAQLRALRPDVLVVRPLAGVVRAAWARERVPGANGFDAVVHALRERAREAGGAVIIERKPDSWHRDLDAWGPTGSPLSLLRRTKQAYDPDGRLNAGRYAGGI